MKQLNIILLSIFFLFIIGSCSKDDTSNNLISLEYHEELNIPYGVNSKQKFDLYLPADRSSITKTLILVHGGGWSAGDKADMNPWIDIIRQDLPNLAIVNINYRLADANNKPYPMQIDDITSVINHLKLNQEKYTISEDFGFIGVSAGAHLALLWSYGFDTTKNVNMVCSIVGPTNLTDPAYLNNTNPELQQMLDYFSIETDLAYLEEVSPLHRVTESAPRSILFYGGQDPLIPTTQGTELRDKLIELNINHQFTLYPNAGHGWVGLDLFDTWLKLKTFINLNL
ncbi:alpha/beta hydrolase fold domain-containing protein [Mariniflexile sp.]|uniref:alpha/beta hydrolase fold domain-containing protein n=1 Tax=Mariniflexile sp. TaxID=1979402 RepID=UPI003563909D